MSLVEHEKDKIKAAIGYDAEVCEPNAKPVRAYLTASFGDEIRERVIRVVEDIVDAREDALWTLWDEWEGLG